MLTEADARSVAIGIAAAATHAGLPEPALEVQPYDLPDVQGPPEWDARRLHRVIVKMRSGPRRGAFVVAVRLDPVVLDVALSRLRKFHQQED